MVFLGKQPSQPLAITQQKTVAADAVKDCGDDDCQAEPTFPHTVQPLGARNMRLKELGAKACGRCRLGKKGSMPRA